METFNSTFYMYILPAIVTGVLTIVGFVIQSVLSKRGNKLVSREITEITNLDGSVIKRKMEIYK